MSKTAEKQKNKRTNILDAAYDLFVNKSFVNTSIDDVVRKAGIAKGTFYLYFTDKYDLVDRLIIQKSTVLLKDAVSSLKTEKGKRNMSFVKQMVFIAERLVGYMQDNKEFVTIADKKLSRCFCELFNTDDAELKSEIDSLIDENLKNGYTREETEKKIYITVDMVSSVCCDAIIRETPFNMSEIKPALFSTIEKILA